MIFEDKHDEGKKIGMKANRKTRRLLSALMIAVLTSVLLSGCGDNGREKDGKRSTDGLPEAPKAYPDRNNR